MGGNSKKVVYALLVLTLLTVCLPKAAQAKSLQDEIKAYLNPNEVASYQTVEVAGARYVVVEVDGKPKLAFDIQAQLVTNETELKKVLNAYALQAEGGAFTLTAAQDLSTRFNDTYAAFQKCNHTLYEYIETNYLWESFKCVEPSVGKACDAAFALRKALSKEMVQLKTEMEALPGYMEQGETESSLTAMKNLVKLANLSYQNATQFDPYYKYFFGKRLADDKDCGMDPRALKEIVDRVSPAIGIKLSDTKTDAGALAQEAAQRRANSDIRRLQVRGEDVMEQSRKNLADAKARFTENGFPTEALDAGIRKMERALLDLEAANSTKAAEIQLNALYTNVADFNGIEAKQTLLIPAYSGMRQIVHDTETLIAEQKLKYDYDEGKVKGIEEDLAALKTEIAATDELLKKGQDLPPTQLQDLSEKAARLKARASGEAPSGPAFDAFPIIAVFIVALGAGLVYFFKVRKRPYH